MQQSPKRCLRRLVALAHFCHFPLFTFEFERRRDDEAFVASFKAEAELAQDFTDDRRELDDAIGDLYTSGSTALLDAIIATADYAHGVAIMRETRRGNCLLGRKRNLTAINPAMRL